MPREAAIVDAIRKALQARGAFVDKDHGGPYQRAGLPDLVAILDGRTVWIECKRPGEIPTPLQRLTLEQIRAAGGHATVAHSVAEALRFVDELI